MLVVTATAPLWFPLLGVLAAAVRLALGSPVMFRQTRVGLNGKLFTILKLRTMRNACGADGVLLPDAERMTRFGRLLRSSSLDELPEMLNILAGDMSLVGPRPLLPQYLPLYSPKHRRRHDVLPGLTGAAQVSGRNALTWSERLDLDVEYVANTSLRTDLTVLARTLSAVVRRKGVAAPGTATMHTFTGYDAD